MNKEIEKRLNLTKQQIRDFCQENNIQELSLFGSVLRDDFNDNSDLDFLVVFKPEFQLSLMDLVDIQYQLENLTRRKVDLIEKSSILDSYNWLRRQHILDTARVIYELRSILSA
ncbi:nucleotidyltransferase domain-containing protein [Cyanobacterium aponinum UTEX 3222]|uniref:DNA polymerase beta domain protein region n=3 Tax=Cyanobacterium aponinum TaxID=379064 RepID=K9Z916_CYAAP|nr:nucleotidyltransferase domain-containing protein [Cyanobacterium aponinum]WRL43150.1 nucleotidyltransferase domain-containing protein [Cyanobacterium aponinum UTEX 3222]AFZ54873.1 DNA polymerase beta domain protein region [Cyanobacterium aponinum PCC 10605]MBD2395398.1 nucleotidyltransferase domain-containing protein [Cyanobacterium aponinum FACHB-4101]MTF40206.1 DNA polymerase subunit beta [Cyanobacterium aponinum 0216]PHV61614.1 DNA polymerase subunit beta [Cyanobacterium aponinum IPPAS B